MNSTRSTLAVMLLALASANLMAAPPEKSGDGSIYQVRMEFPFPEGLAGAAHGTEPDQDVPAGKLLIIRNVNYRLTLPSGQRGVCRITRFGGLPLLFVSAPVSWVELSYGAALGYGNMSTEVLLDEGDYTVGCGRSSGAGEGYANVTITGTLIDAP